MTRYSRLASVEERRNFRKTVWFIVLTIGVGVFLFFIGIPILGRFVAFVSSLGKGNTPISQSDSTPPAPPKFNTFSDFTNSKTVDLNGTSEAGATVKLTFNGQSIETVVDKNGQFSFADVSLLDGVNSFSGLTEDSAGNISQESKTYTITYDAKPPELNIDFPADGTQFFGSKQRQITIQGVTEAGCQITINDRIIVVDDSGKFQLTTSLGDGENKFNVKSTDQAGNTSEKGLTLTFSP